MLAAPAVLGAAAADLQRQQLSAAGGTARPLDHELGAAGLLGDLRQGSNVVTCFTQSTQHTRLAL